MAPVGVFGPAIARVLRPAPVGAQAAPGAPGAEVADWEVPGGRFFTQTAPPDAPPDSGYPVVDREGAGLWSAYRALGGPGLLGYPVSAAFEAEGVPYQAMQAGLLAWDPGAGHGFVYPLFGETGNAEFEDWLEAQGVPRVAAALREDPGLPAAERLAWLTQDDLRGAYLADGEEGAERRFGLPMGGPERRGPYLAQRFEKAVLQLWLDEVPGQPRPGTVSLVQVGDLLRARGEIPEEAVTPREAPAPRPRPAPVAPATAPAVAVAAAVVGGKYVTVSVGRQAWTAFENGRVVNGGPVTTGRPELYTPMGRFTVLSKHSPYTFVSPWGRGSPFWYETATSRYALRITGNGIFLHDAPWRPYYGPGTNRPHTDPDGVWRTGSHGCINMPFQAAAWLYGWAPVGTPVDVVA